MEVRRKSGARRYKDNRGEVLEKRHQKYIEDPGVKKEYNTEYYKENRERLNAEQRERSAKNRPAINKHRKRRYHSDPLYKLIRLLRSRVSEAITRGTKSAKTVELLGAPWVWVEAYLEEQFLPGMSWENHGPVWHVDHIRPLASFDLTDPDQQKICFHWTNLQPLFAPDNLRKGDTYDLNV